TSEEQPVAILVRGIPESSLNTLLWNTFGWQLLACALVLCAGIAMTWFLRGSIVKPLKKLTDVAEDFSAGNREVRAETSSSDEIGLLTATFNEMADNIVASETNLSNLARQREVEVQKQRQEKERLQQEVIQLLLEIEGAQDGDLTIRAKVTDGVVGSIADAFNTTIGKLRQLLLAVEKVSEQVSNRARSGENSVLELSHAAKNQSREIDRVLDNVGEMNSSISEVANSAALAAKIARRARTEARVGDTTMDRTVESIEKIRGTVALGAKKVKQLAESSLEISQIVAIISGISEKTNVLAFNASIEAARAGENGQGFRVVADEVRRLADRVQQEIGAVLQTMDVGTTEVVTGTELVGKTKEILQDLVKTSQEIDHYLQTISQSTMAQTHSSQQINETIEDVAAIALTTSTEALDVVQSLSSLVSSSETLSSSVAQFRLKS
ncbi:MAG: HAMP domain-containing protein, partial [Prochloron sp. SP5CPC1]|nr:HAMP domain-containing protein [Candidatus Paraprochloron terpiosi SP5CPC1]